jgi:hypothetical protein
VKAKADKTLADIVVIAISPGLIMALVGSLVFFLAEVLYVGQYQGSLLWILFFFVFGAVLVARISIEYDAGRATLYGLILGGLAWIGMFRYVEYPAGTFAADFGWAINLGLLAVIWWSSHKLTWDCTMIDDAQDASGTGLMQAAGLEGDADSSKPKPKRGKKKDSDLAAWWRRYQQYREEQKARPQAPGVWVVYFSLAALPLYGLGQSLIPPADQERRRYVFWLMSVYVASGLGLLLTTCFLGLRRYLRQKKVQMPAAMTGVWLTLGAALILGFLVVGTFLPRPAAEYALIELPWRAGSKERDASRFAKRGDETGKDEGRRGGKEKQGDDAQGKDKPGGKDQSDKGDKGGDQGKADDKGAKKADDGKEDAKSAPEQQGNADPKFDLPPLPDWTAQLGQVLKWIVIGLFVLVIAFFLLRAVLVFLANFTGWARNLLAFFRAWWQGLVNREGAKAAAGESGVNAKPAPFAAFADPFASGAAEQMSPAELIRYTFEALQSWAAEHDLARGPGETPLEFAERLAQDFPELAAGVRQLANYYAGLAYSGQTLTGDCSEPLRQLWETLVETAHRNQPAELPSR